MSGALLTALLLATTGLPTPQQDPGSEAQREAILIADFEGEVNPESLVKRGVVRSGMPIKVLGNGEISAALKVKAHKFSATARAKIEAAGGSCEVLES